MKPSRWGRRLFFAVVLGAMPVFAGWNLHIIVDGSADMVKNGSYKLVGQTLDTQIRGWKDNGTLNAERNITVTAVGIVDDNPFPFFEDLKFVPVTLYPPTDQLNPPRSVAEWRLQAKSPLVHPAMKEQFLNYLKNTANGADGVIVISHDAQVKALKNSDAAKYFRVICIPLEPAGNGLLKPCEKDFVDEANRAIDDFVGFVAPPPEVSVMRTPTGKIAPGQKVIFTTRNKRAASLVLDFGDGTPVKKTGITETPVEHVYNKAGEYLAAVTAMGANGKTAVATEFVVVSAPPTTGISPAEEVKLAEDLKAKEAALKADAELKAKEASRKTEAEAARRTEAEATRKTAEEAARIDKFPTILAAFEIEPSTPKDNDTSTVEKGVEVQFQNKSKGAESYKWDFGDGTESSTKRAPSHTYENAGTYKASLTVTGASGANASCTKTVVVPGTSGWAWVFVVLLVGFGGYTAVKYFTLPPVTISTTVAGEAGTPKTVGLFSHRLILDELSPRLEIMPLKEDGMWRVKFRSFEDVVIEHATTRVPLQLTGRTWSASVNLATYQIAGSGDSIRIEEKTA